MINQLQKKALFHKSFFSLKRGSVMYKTIFVIITLFTCVCNILILCGFKIVVFLFLRERVCSPKEFAILKNFL